MEITPWETKGEIDYRKLIKYFGVTPIDEVLEYFDESFPLNRDFLLSHRDFDRLMRDFKQGKSFGIVSGIGPSSSHLHLGHIIIFSIVKWFQDKYNINVYIPISDDEKFLTKEKQDLDKTYEFRDSNIKDVLALGFKKGKTFVFRDLESRIYKYAVVFAKKITYSTAKAVFGLKNENNIGWVFYPAIQTTHLLLPMYLGLEENVLVIMGIDQDPYLRISRDVSPKFGLNKPAALHTKFLPSFYDLNQKMSSSEGNAIFLGESSKEIKSKLWNMLTGGRDTKEEQRKLGGNPEKCVVNYYLKLFKRDNSELCKKGEKLCGECKDELFEIIKNLYDKIIEKREKINIEDYLWEDF